MTRTSHGSVLRSRREACLGWASLQRRLEVANHDGALLSMIIAALLLRIIGSLLPWVVHRYAQDVNTERAEDVLTHMQMLGEARRTAPQGVPVIHVRAVRVSTQV